MLAGYDPDISCEEKGPCYSNQAGGAYENPDYTKKEVVKEEGKKPVEAPKVEPVKPVETENKDPFAAFPSDDTSTGSIKVEEKKEDKKTEEKKKDDKAVTTTVDNDNFQLEWNDCIYEEQLKLFNEEGEKTIDPEAKSREEKRAEALEELKNGYCDVAILGSDFCSGWQRELDSKKVVEEIDLSYPEKYRIAVTRLEMFGECDREVLSQAYCDKYFTDLSSTPVDDSLEPEIEENEDLPPNTVIPDHISGSGFFDGADGNPSEGTPKTEE
ncbi:MAG: hypothetical protein EOO43_22155 [Flavobacterium sp.]|nr:MAG: hypothetical protein EOO43_22155 [Flavobacterium sp.]